MKRVLKKVTFSNGVLVVVLLGLACMLGKLAEELRKPKEAVGVLAEESKNWGLSFQEEGKAPVADVGKESLKEQDAYYMSDTSEKKIYLTFDCGYENGNTTAILDALAAHKAPATFFVVGHYLESAPDLVKRMVSDGHLVGNHSYHHPDMTGMDREDFLMELESLEVLYEKITGEKMVKFYRPPQGKYNENNLSLAKELGYQTFFWSLAYVDWKTDAQPTREDALEKLTKRVHPGAIVLLHTTSATNGQILEELLGIWEDMGYTFGSLQDFGKKN